MARDQIIVGIDVGTTKVCTLIADVTGDVPEILGVGIAPSQGIRKGVVVDAQAAVEAMDASLRRAEQQSGFKALSAFVGIAGAHILSTNSHAVVAVRHPDRAISLEDVARVIDGARVIQLPPDQEIIHVLPQHFVVDGMNGIKDPIGMVGRRLEIEANVVTGALTSIHNIMRCVEAIDVELDALVLQPLAAGRAVLSDEEQDFGAMVIDLGGGTTDAAVFSEGTLIHSCTVPVGGSQISNDLAFGLRVSFPAAEELKIRHGSTIAQARGEGQAVPVSSYDWDAGQQVEQRVVAEIIDARLAETFEMVQVHMQRAGLGEGYPAGVVLTGGTALIPGATALAAEVFGVPARLGVPHRLGGLADTIRGPAYAATVGLLDWGREQLVASSHPQGKSGISRVGAALKAWLRNFLA